VNWIPIDPDDAVVGDFVRWIEGTFSANYRERFPASYLGNVGQVTGITRTGIQLRVVASFGDAPLTITGTGQKPTFRTKSKLGFYVFERRQGGPIGTASHAAQETLAQWEKQRTQQAPPVPDLVLGATRVITSKAEPLPEEQSEGFQRDGVANCSEGKPGRRTYSTVYIDPVDRNALASLLKLTDDASDRWLWRFFDHLAFGSSFNEVSGAILLDHKTLSAITEQSHRSGAYSAYEYIQEFQNRTGVRLDVTLPNALAGKARTVERAEYPPGVEEVVGRARRTALPINARVAFDTGQSWTTDIRVQQRLYTREEALIRAADAINPDAIRLLRMLNEAPPNRWAPLDAHIPHLRRAAESLEPPESREYALNVLAKIEPQPKPFFTPVERSCRLYGIGTTILSLPRELRKEVVRSMGWRSLDLKQAQLAVVAHLWGVPALQAFVESGASFWQEMLAVLRLNERYKPFIKNLLYALVFGEGEGKAKARFREQFGANSDELWDRWKANPIIIDLLQARDRTIKEYQRKGGAEDAYGHWWSITGRTRINSLGQSYSGTNAINVLATVAQSYELKLLSPVLDILEAVDRRVQLVYWLHDGFTVSVPANRDYIVGEMKDAVDAQARRMKIATTLEDE
jgi:hypothetical protein